MRADIQALRAVAIGSVVFFHFWPVLLPGGYVGVDIFFVVSGYLITGQLWRQVQLNGKVNFRDFWSRRARRLLPASLLAIATVVLIAYWRMPSSWFLKLREDGVGSIVYLQNWVLAGRSTDYLNADADPSALQHFWSLSVEEQYYVVWPLLMFALLWLTQKLLRRLNISARGAILGGLTLILLGSLAYSVWFTGTMPLYAFFSTYTRAWEFAAGALMAVWLGSGDPAADRLKAQSRNPIWWWLGLGLIITAFSTLNSQTPFPSFWASIPVLGAVLFLFGGESSSRWVPTWLMRFAPIQFLGNISYSLYLWHWPVLMLSPWFVVGKPNDWQLTGLVALSILLGWLSKQFVEDPIRFGRISKLGPFKQLLAAGMAMVLAYGVVAGTARLAKNTLDANGGEDQIVADSPLNAGVDFTPPDSGDCLVSHDKYGFKACEKGDPNGTIRVGFIGDSHTRQYFTPIDNLAHKYHWKLTMISKSACPIANSSIFPTSVTSDTCKDWNSRLEKYFTTIEPFDLIINSNSSGVTHGDPAVAAAYAMTAKTQLARGTKWFVIKDNPKPMDNFIPCIIAAGANAALACANSREAAMYPVDLLPGAIANLPGVTVANFTDVFCHRVCPALIHGVMVYRDRSHITSKFSRLMQPKLDAVIPVEFKK